MRSYHIMGAVCVVCLFLMGVSYAEVMRENEELRNKFSRYQIASGKNFARTNDNIKDLKVVESDYRVPAELLKAIEIHENIGNGFSFGVKRDAPGVQDKYPPALWQAASAAFIIQDEAVQFALEEKNAKEFMTYLGKRYCEWDSKWGRSVYAIYKQGVLNEKK